MKKIMEKMNYSMWNDFKIEKRVNSFIPSTLTRLILHTMQHQHYRIFTFSYVFTWVAL